MNEVQHFYDKLASFLEQEMVLSKKTITAIQEVQGTAEKRTLHLLESIYTVVSVDHSILRKFASVISKQSHTEKLADNILKEYDG